MTTRRYALRDDQWERIKDLLPGRDSHVGVTAKDNRLFIEAVLHRYRAGSAWRDLPARFGDFRVVHIRFSRWAKTGVWEKVFQQLSADADNEYAMIDATIVRAHQHSAGAKKADALRSGLPIRDKLRSEWSCQAGLRGWLEEKLPFLARSIWEGVNYQFLEWLADRFNSAQISIFRSRKIFNRVSS